jgi:hypothetical protein
MLASISALAQDGSTTPHKRKPVQRQKPLVEMASGQGYGMAGCGLGSIVFGQQTGPIQIIAATLNGTGVQTFGITSGTSNCADDGTSRREASLFIEVNRHALKKDASRGSGETLANFSSILGCSNVQPLGQALQHNFEKVFNDDSLTSEQVSDSILNLIKNDQRLAQNCNRVG